MSVRQKTEEKPEITVRLIEGCMGSDQLKGWWKMLQAIPVKLFAREEVAAASKHPSLGSGAERRCQILAPLGAANAALMA